MMDFRKLMLLAVSLIAVLPLSAQVEKKEVRAGNRRFNKENYSQAEIDYRKALVKDSTSFAAAYDLASTLYREKDFENAGKALEKVKDQAPESQYGSRWYFNEGDVALQKKDYKAAVDAFKQALLRDPGDLEAKENYIYAKKKLDDQQNQDQQNQNQDQNQNGQNNQDNKDQQQDQNQNNQNKDQQNQQNQPDQQNQNQDQQQGQQEQQQISAQQAQQLLNAIQAKEKETQDKVEKAKAEQAQTRRKEKNW